LAGTTLTNADGSSIEQINNSDNIVTNYYNTDHQATSSDTVYTAGGSSHTDYDTDDSGSQTYIYDDNKHLIGTAIINGNGVSVLSQIDPTSGETILSTVYDENGNPIIVTGNNFRMI
jgi:hypothetical protein